MKKTITCYWIWLCHVFILVGEKRWELSSGFRLPHRPHKNPCFGRGKNETRVAKSRKRAKNKGTVRSEAIRELKRFWEEFEEKVDPFIFHHNWCKILSINMTSHIRWHIPTEDWPRTLSSFMRKKTAGGSCPHDSWCTVCPTPWCLHVTKNTKNNHSRMVKTRFEHWINWIW